MKALKSKNKLKRNFELYNLLYELPNLTNKEIISDNFYKYCKKGEYFVIIALYNSKNEFFIQRNFIRNNNPWELVGGWVNPDETFDQSLDRIVYREAQNLLVEATPIAKVMNVYTTRQGKKVVHNGIAFIGRLKDDVSSSQNGIFVNKLPSQFGDIDHKVVNLGKKLLKSKKIDPPLEEIGYLNRLGLKSTINKYLIKPAIFNFSSKILYNNLRRALHVSNGEMILDVACGDDLSLLKLEEKYSLLVANDISRESMSALMAKSSGKRIFFTNHNLLDMKYNILFDIVICKNVMHHMSNDKEVEIMLKNLRRLGKKIVIMDIENPNENLIAKLWNIYYIKFLDDKGGHFVNYSKFKEIVNNYFRSTHKMEFKRIKTIKGNYMMATILER